VLYLVVSATHSSERCSSVSAMRFACAVRAVLSVFFTCTKQNARFFSTFPCVCVSRACLGKLIVLRVKMTYSTGAFLAPPPPSTSAAPVWRIRTQLSQASWRISSQSTRLRPLSSRPYSQTVRKRLFLNDFSYVCPEPVLVKGPIYDKMAPKKRFLTSETSIVPSPSASASSLKHALILNFSYVCPEPVLVN
jgi:hypothetical protein